jgi:hypothetical protein
LQVKLFSNTDVVVSQHGAQLTNLIFMDSSSSVMEFHPKGWLELAGSERNHLYPRLANLMGMRHEGIWNDMEDGGEPCPLSSAMDPQCMRYYKNWRIGDNASYLAGWANRVLIRAKQYKIKQETISDIAMQSPMHHNGTLCSCKP